MKQHHNIQLKILKKLLFSPILRYSDMKPDPKMDNNQFDFHLKQLIKLEYVQKNDDGYQLTISGKEYAGRMDTDAAKVMKQSKIGSFIYPIRTTGTEPEILVFTRLKHPFYGSQGSMSGKTNFGEKFFEAAAREFYEETGMTGQPELVQVRHYLDYDKETGALLEDKTIFSYRVMNPAGELIQTPEGIFEWVAYSNLKTYLKNPFRTVKSYIDHVDLHLNFDGTITFEEIIAETDKF